MFQCVRPVRYFKGVPSPLKRPELVDMVIFRENTEDIYAGVEWESGSDDARKVIKFLTEEMGVRNIRFPATSGIGIKPISVEGTQLRHMGWKDAADLVIHAMEAAIGDKQVTYDFARLMEGADEVSCSGFGDAMIARM